LVMFLYLQTQRIYSEQNADLIWMCFRQ
jgi:hypothetical protein